MIDLSVGYPEMAAQMVLLGAGLGPTNSTRDRLHHGVVRPEQAGAGSAVNDATRQVGGTLGVAVIGSIFSTLYIRQLTDSPVLCGTSTWCDRWPAEAWQGPGLLAAQSLGPASAAVRERTAGLAFSPVWGAGCLVAAGICLAGAV